MKYTLIDETRQYALILRGKRMTQMKMLIATRFSPAQAAITVLLICEMHPE